MDVDEVELLSQPPEENETADANPGPNSNDEDISEAVEEEKVSPSSVSPEKVANDEEIPPKPSRSGYGLFIKEHQSIFKEAGQNAAVRMKTLGQNWGKLSTEEKEEYSLRNKEMKKKYEEFFARHPELANKNEAKKSGSNKTGFFERYSFLSFCAKLPFGKLKK